MRPYVTGKGSYNAICDVCGFAYKSYQLQKRWDGFMVCKEDWEPRNVLDFPEQVKEETPALPWTRPESPEPP